MAGKQWDQPPVMQIDPEKIYLVTIATSRGTIELELYPQHAPKTVNNFVFLARDGYYDSVKFHRVIKGFMIQGGDPTGTGSGSPGYSFADELPTTRNYIGGTLAMANAGPNTNGSQFFICLTNLTGTLQKNYTIFGQVTSGMDVVLKIGDVPVKVGNEPTPSVPTVDVHIITVTID